ncbi:MAG: hypothetical protein GEU68_07940 [Actinobacteria bacterium]|nr:hypothetical protein [Actinomycetota bacterium]
MAPLLDRCRCSAGFSSDRSRSNETEIRTVIEDWAKAVREVDMGGILAHHTEDILMFDVPPPLQWKGIEAYRKTWDLFFNYSDGGEGSFDLHSYPLESE